MYGLRVSAIARDLASIAFGKPYDLRTAHRVVAFDSVQLVPLAGRYRLGDGSIATISVESALLGIEIPGRFTVGGVSLGDDAFYVPFFENVVKLSRDRDGRGRLIRLRINGEDLRGTRVDSLP